MGAPAARPRLAVTAALAALAALGALGARAPRVAAQPSEVDRARQEYDLGYQALQAGHYQDALDHYQRSYQLAPRPRTLFNLAQAEELLGRIDDAIADYTQFVAQAEPRDAEFVAQARKKLAALSAPRPAPVAAATPAPAPAPGPGPAPAPPPSPPAPAPAPVLEPTPPVVAPSRPDARCRVGAAGTLEVRADVAGASVSVDGLVVGATADRDGAGPALRYPLAAGEHDVVVEGPAAATWRQRVRAGDGDAIRVELAFRTSRGRSGAWRWGLGGLGVVSGAAAATLGVLALRDVASPDEDLHARGKTRALETDALLVVTAAALYGAWRLGPAPAVAATVRSDGAAEAR